MILITSSLTWSKGPRGCHRGRDAVVTKDFHARAELPMVTVTYFVVDFDARGVSAITNNNNNNARHAAQAVHLVHRSFVAITTETSPP